MSYKKGKRGQFLRDKKGFKKYDVVDGKTDLTNPYLSLKSFNRNRLRYSNPNSVPDLRL